MRHKCEQSKEVFILLQDIHDISGACHIAARTGPSPGRSTSSYSHFQVLKNRKLHSSHSQSSGHQHKFLMELLDRCLQTVLNDSVSKRLNYVTRCTKRDASLYHLSKLRDRIRFTR